MPIVRTAARTAIGARQVVKDLGRLQQIAQVLARHGLGWLVANAEVPGFGLLRKVVGEGARAEPTPARVAAVIRDLGPTFVKLGQMMSTRSDVIPEAYAAALAPLLDDVGPMAWADVENEITRSLGGKPQELYARFDREPLATASIAQVHRAKLKSGEEVAVKVRRPGVRDLIETDLSVLMFLSRAVETQLPEVQLLDLPGVLRELQKAVIEETDFRIEAEYLERFAANFAGQDDIVIPAVHDELTSESVLTMDFLEGVKIARARDEGHDMRAVGRRYLAASFQMLLEDGLFHADLHPGNVVVMEGGRLGLLDFGMVGRLSEEMRENLVTLFFAIQRRDFRTIARVYWEIAIRTEHVDYNAFETDTQVLMERQVVGRSMAELHLEAFIRELSGNALKHKVRMTPAYTLFFRAVVTTQGLAKQLLPEVDPLEEMMPYVERMARELYSPERLREEVFYYFTSLRYTIRRMPVVAGQLLQDLQEGRLRLRTVEELSPAEAKRRDRQTNRLVAAGVFAALFVGSSLALFSSAAPLLGLPAPATVGYFLSFFVLGALVIGLLRSGRL